MSLLQDSMLPRGAEDLIRPASEPILAQAVFDGQAAFRNITLAGQLPEPSRPCWILTPHLGEVSAVGVPSSGGWHKVPVPADPKLPPYRKST